MDHYAARCGSGRRSVAFHYPSQRLDPLSRVLTPTPHRTTPAPTLVPHRITPSRLLPRTGFFPTPCPALDHPMPTLTHPDPVYPPRLLSPPHPLRPESRPAPVHSFSTLIPHRSVPPRVSSRTRPAPDPSLLGFLARGTLVTRPVHPPRSSTSSVPIL